MIFPDIRRAFLDRVSVRVTVVCPQTARTKVQAHVLWSPVPPSRRPGLLCVSIVFHRANHKSLSASERLPKRLPLPGEKVQGWEGSSFAARVTQLASHSAGWLHYASLKPPVRE